MGLLLVAAGGRDRGARHRPRDFDDWMRQEARGESGLGLVTLFYPMSRVERMERDETVGGLEGIADRFRRETGRSIAEAAGLGRSLSSRRRPR